MNKHSMRPVSRLLKLIIGVSPFMASGMMVAYAETQVSTQDITQLGPLKVSAKSQRVGCRVPLFTARLFLLYRWKNS